jgi:hypothetical protein
MDEPVCGNLSGSSPMVPLILIEIVPVSAALKDVVFAWTRKSNRVFSMRRIFNDKQWTREPIMENWIISQS